MHLAVDEVYLVIIEKKSVRSYGKAKLLAEFSLAASCVFNYLLYNIKIEERFAAEKVKLKMSFLPLPKSPVDAKQYLHLS